MSGLHDGIVNLKYFFSFLDLKPRSSKILIISLEEILKLVSEFTGKTAPTINIPAKLVLPIAYLTQAWAKITKSSEPFITVDGVRMSQQKMYYDSSKAELELGYKSRPAKVAIRDAIEWFGEHGYLN